MLASLLVSALGAIAFQTLLADEPAASTPPAQSIREWRTTPSQAPADSLAATPSAQAAADAPVGTTTPATSIREWRSTTSPAPAAGAAATPTTTVPATSIREWRTTPSPVPSPCSTASPIAGVSATPAANPPVGSPASAAVPTTPITISLKSTLRQGNLVVLIDDVPVFNEKFQKPLLVISQTSTWDPLQVAAGTHRLSAVVHGTKKKYLSKTYDLELSRTKGAALRFVIQGDKLTVTLGS